MQNFGRAANDVLGVPLPAAAAAEQIAAFQFIAEDRSNTTHVCMLTTPAGADATPAGAAAVPGFALNAEYNCTSPQVFSVLTAGAYAFSVFSIDDSGNVESTPATHPFTVSYGAGAVHTQVRGPPWGATNVVEQAFALAGVQGSADGAGTAAAGVAFESETAVLAAGVWDAGDWLPVTTGSTFNFAVRCPPPPLPSRPAFGSTPLGVATVAALAVMQSRATDVCSRLRQLNHPPCFVAEQVSRSVQAPVDGEFRVRLRAAAGAAAATANPATEWRLTIDSTPPTVVFDTEPPEIVLTDTILMRVSSNEEGVTWECALQRLDTDAIAQDLLRPCDLQPGGVIQYGDLMDGSTYTFGIRATDGAGNASPILLRQWLVDAGPPRLVGPMFPAATRDEEVTLRFSVTDGPAGTGLASVLCGVRWLGASPAADADFVPCAAAAAAARRLRQADCPACEAFEHVLPTEEEGIWGFTVRATDGANQTLTTPEATIVVDRVAPQATWAQLPRNPSPSVFTFTMDVVDDGPYPSAIVGSLCALSRAGDARDAAFSRQANASVVLDETATAGTTMAADFVFQDVDGVSQQGAFATWYPCGAPANFSGVESGAFVLQAMPVDAAGNAGAVLAADIAVDASLAVDDVQTVGDGARSIGQQTFIIIGAVAAAVVVLAFVGIVLASRHRRRSTRAALRSANASHELQPMSGGAFPVPTRGRGAAGGIVGDDEATRMERALELSMVQAGVEASRQQQRDDIALKLAIEASLTA